MKFIIDIQDGTSCDEIEDIIDKALNDAGIDCYFEVTDKD